MSAASAANVMVTVASAVLRLKPARERAAPVRKWVTGSIAWPSLWQALPEMSKARGAFERRRSRNPLGLRRNQQGQCLRNNADLARRGRGPQQFAVGLHAKPGGRLRREMKVHRTSADEREVCVRRLQAMKG